MEKNYRTNTQIISSIVQLLDNSQLKGSWVCLFKARETKLQLVITIRRIINQISQIILVTSPTLTPQILTSIPNQSEVPTTQYQHVIKKPSSQINRPKWQVNCSNRVKTNLHQITWVPYQCIISLRLNCCKLNRIWNSHKLSYTDITQAIGHMGLNRHLVGILIIGQQKWGNRCLKEISRIILQLQGIIRSR